MKIVYSSNSPESIRQRASMGLPCNEYYTLREEEWLLRQVAGLGYVCDYGSVAYAGYIDTEQGDDMILTEKGRARLAELEKLVSANVIFDGWCDG